MGSSKIKALGQSHGHVISALTSERPRTERAVEKNFVCEI